MPDFENEKEATFPVAYPLPRAAMPVLLGDRLRARNDDEHEEQINAGEADQDHAVVNAVHEILVL